MSQGPSFWFDTRVYLAVAAALLVIIAFYNRYLAVIGAILLYALYRYGRERHIEQQKALHEYLETVPQYIDQAAYDALQNLPIGIAVVNGDGIIHWRNNVLAEWTAGKLTAGRSIFAAWPDLDLKHLRAKAEPKILAVGDKYYEVMAKPLQNRPDNDNGGDWLLVYFSDITTQERIRRQSLEAMPVMAYINIDNYSDVLQGLNDNQRAAVLSQVSALLTEWIDQLGGILKRLSGDTYIALFTRKGLQQVCEDRFEILDKVRSIQAGNKIPVTLSIGVAADEQSLSSLGQRAQAGVDLALGRGGDQAAVYIDGKVHFYGGKAKAVEKNTRVKARVVAQALREIISDADLVLVMGHVNEDFDSLGAALGVAKMARYLQRKTHIVISQRSSAMAKIEELLPDYTEYRDVFLSPAQAAAIVKPNTLLFVVDVHRPALTAAPQLLELVDRVVVIDHHRRSEDFIVNPMLVYLEPSASSTGELVTELLMYFDDRLELTRLEASVLYAGIVVDTKNFTVQTGVRTFDAAAYLRRAGADPGLVRHLFKVDLDTVKLHAEIITNTEMLPGGVAIATCPYPMNNAQIIAAQTADGLLNVEGVRVSFVIFLLDDGVGVSARSLGDVNVQVIMEQLGGGGHQTVAGAQIKNAQIDEVKEKILALITEYIKESEQSESHSAGRS